MKPARSLGIRAGFLIPVTIFGRAMSADQITNYAAWWGATIATAVLFWDVWKWRRDKAAIEMTVRPNMTVIGEPELEDKYWIKVSATNKGTRPTTIKMVGAEIYPSFIEYIMKRNTEEYVFPNAGMQDPLPRVLNPGEEWSGLVPQIRKDKQLNLLDLASEKIVVLVLQQTIAPKLVRVRLSGTKQS
jgi:hypothetical protein